MVPLSSSSSRSRSPAPSAARTRTPASFSAATARSTGTPTATGRWKCEPTEARTALGLYRSTEASVRITASAPAASAQRSTVPALPGSRTWARTATSFGRAARMSSNGVSRNRQTPTRPCGVTVVEMSAMTSSDARCIRAPASRAAPMMSAYRSAASTVANSSTRVGTPSTRCPAASRTACGPSARNSRSFPRKFRLASRRAAETRVERGEISSGVGILWVTFSEFQRAAGPVPRRGAGNCASDHDGPALERRPTRQRQDPQAIQPAGPTVSVDSEPARRHAALGAFTSDGSAFCATSTSAAKAFASFTASSARILRSTSTFAAFRPWMKRL
ncbi:hypothetical protein SCANM63S_09693 [Streptomyces canarius]